MTLESVQAGRVDERQLRQIEPERAVGAGLDLLDHLGDLIDRPAPGHRFILFCDDLSFERGDSDYKALKSVLDGGIEGRPENVLFYATSNRRHLMPRDMIENERSTAINPSEATEEKVSLSDRFGLWIGFHNCDQPTFFAMVEGYAEAMYPLHHYGWSDLSSAIEGNLQAIAAPRPSAISR